MEKPKKPIFSIFDLGIVFMIIGLVMTAVFCGWGMFFSLAFICAGVIMTESE